MKALYFERGLSRGWLLLAPVAAAAMIVTQVVLLGRTDGWWLWIVIGLVAEGFVWLQVTAGRTHVSVELTADELRCGDETVPVSEIAEILPGRAPDHPKKSDPSEHPGWMSARVLGRLRTVPRRRYGIGVKLADGSVVQAWARNDYALRAALEPLLKRRSEGVESEA